MNYQKIYDSLIKKRKNNPPDGYVEKHHIIPLSLGGEDNPKNIISLTAREHFICHLLLVKIYQDTPNFYPMIKALAFMRAESTHNGRYFNSHLYQYFRKAHGEAMSIAQTGELNSQYGTRWIHNPILEKSKKLSRSKPLPSGWKEGRVINWANYRLVEEGRAFRKKILQDKIEYYRKIYPIYKKEGFESFVEKTGYEYSQENFTQQCKKYLPEWESIQGQNQKRG